MSAAHRQELVTLDHSAIKAQEQTLNMADSERDPENSIELQEVVTQREGEPSVQAN